ncbi:extracellular solute-binding protein [Thiohalorhabdus methylotrophus]|uniref:Extracellular solute-binding protein n=1 Tax=Thiohalorhabdus methylotrophus TaxID=3242694 RepID=A0ABV4U0S2_9GAMM
MDRRAFLQGASALGVLGTSGILTGCSGEGGADAPPALSVEKLPELAGDLTVYLGRGEGGLYSDVVEAIRKRNPDLNLEVRRGPSSALANTLVEEGKRGGARADLFWSIDASSLGRVIDQGLAREIPSDLRNRVMKPFRFESLAPVTGRVRTVAYNTERLTPADIPEDIMALPERNFRVGWAPAYGAFQSFVTAMRILEGDQATLEWLRAMKPKAREYAGELGAVMAAAQGEVDLSLANHYYTLRLKAGKPDMNLALAYTRGDAGSLINTSGVALLSPGQTAVNFVRYLQSREVQSYLAREGYEIPLVPGVPTPEGVPALERINPPQLDLTRLGNLQPTLELMRRAGVL